MSLGISHDQRCISSTPHSLSSSSSSASSLTTEQLEFDPHSLLFMNTRQEIPHENRVIRFDGGYISIGEVTEQIINFLLKIHEVTLVENLDDGRKQVCIKGCHYVGFVNDRGQPSGHGVVKVSRGTYQGEFANGLPEGEGVLSRYDRKITGSFRKGQPHGYIEMEFVDFNEFVRRSQGPIKTIDVQGLTMRYSYKGDYFEGKRHGFGVHHSPTGTYEGGWHKNQKQGAGKFIWPNGEIYEGEWKQDKRHGPGRHVWPNGDTFVGEWYKGLKHGWGVFTSKNDVSLEGDWYKDDYVEEPIPLCVIF